MSMELQKKGLTLSLHLLPSFFESYFGRGMKLILLGCSPSLLRLQQMLSAVDS
jgi:hypothetical protein